MVTPELYAGVFPEQATMLEGFEQVHENLAESHDKLERDTATTEQVIAIFRKANALGQLVTATSAAGLFGGPFTLEINSILEHGQFPKLRAIKVGKDQRLMPLKSEQAEQRPDSHPIEYFRATNAMGTLHGQAFDAEHTASSMSIMGGVCDSLGHRNMAGLVTLRALECLLERDVDHNIYYAEQVTLPYKSRLFDPRKYKTQSEIIEGAKNAIKTFATSPDTFPAITPDSLRGSNYDTLMRGICVSYAALRRANLRQDKAIAALYANGDTFSNFTATVTGYHTWHHPLILDGSNESGVDMEKYRSFEFLYSRLPSVSFGADGPRLHFARQAPYDEAKLPADAPEHLQKRLENKRRTSGRCPIRHTVAPIRNRDDKITAFDAMLKETHGVDPHILVRGRIHPTSLMAAMAIRAAKHYQLFDALDETGLEPI